MLSDSIWIAESNSTWVTKLNVAFSQTDRNPTTDLRAEQCRKPVYELYWDAFTSRCLKIILIIFNYTSYNFTLSITKIC